MTKDELFEMFEAEVMPSVLSYEARLKEPGPDYPARCEAWANWTDMLLSDGVVTQSQLDEWGEPDYIDRRGY